MAVEEARIFKLANIVLAGGAFLGLVSLVAPNAAFGADPRVGSWVLSSAVSSLDPPDKLVIDSDMSKVHVTMTGETRLEFTADAKGKPTPAPSNPLFDAVEMHRIDKRQVDVIQKKNGALVATIRNAVSKDGKELTLTTTRPGKPTQISVWTRTAGHKEMGDPFAGTWTQDVSRTRMRQGMPLTIEAVGGDGVRFTGDYNYTAHIDGKSYDVHNSRNDTVQLSQPDAHTVDATFRRDSQVSQKDEWSVAPDGKTMTLTSTGTLEDGQHFAEKLVFLKK